MYENRKEYPYGSASSVELNGAAFLVGGNAIFLFCSSELSFIDEVRAGEPIEGERFKGGSPKSVIGCALLRSTVHLQLVVSVLLFHIHFL